jgi:putative protease
LRRVTLARELSLEELRAIRASTGCELEIFVHGALCVAYSGQCFSSEAWGGRSANRGQCAQACRQPYELIVDGTARPLGDARYLLSPEDLYALRQLPEIVDIGIAALKIEGRYKDADYVALATRAYRQALDEAWAGRAPSLDAAGELELAQVYSRGFGPHFLTGTNHQRVVRGRSPRHRGVLLGRVVTIERDSILVAPSEAHAIAPLKAGDGVVFDAADWRSPELPEEGGRVYEVTARGAALRLRFANGAVDFSRIRPGDRLWRTHDPDVDRAARPYLEANQPLARQLVDVRVTAGEAAPLVAEWSLTARPAVAATVMSGDALGVARQRGLDEAALREQFGRLGGTPYELHELTLDVTGTPFAPASLLNQLRREAVDALAALQRQLPAMEVNDPDAAYRDARAAAAMHRPVEPMTVPALHLLVRTSEQLDAALELAPASITLDYLDLMGLRPSLDRVVASGIPVRVASPRILKPGEERIADYLASLGCAILVRSTGLLHRLRGNAGNAGLELIGDFSLNAANTLSAAGLLSLGLRRLTPTHDLNADQVAELARECGAQALEAIVYQHLPVFHTEHCVFCRFLSTGTSYKDCGRPCESHRVALRDSNGRAHPVLADVGCRNTVFGAEAQEAAAHLERWRAAGLVHFRIEFAHESANDVLRVVDAFQRALAGSIRSAALSAELKRIAPQGSTEGSLFVPDHYREFPILQ